MTIHYSGPREFLDKAAQSVVVFDPQGDMVTAEHQKNSEEVRQAVDMTLRDILTGQNNTGKRLFRIVAIETTSGCNLSCSFCPVGKLVDRRASGELSWNILTKILGELEDIRYADTVNLFGNNEPLLDERIFSIVRLARKKLPIASIKIVTNGTQADRNTIHSLFDAGLSRLVINNYSKSVLVPVVSDILENSSEFDEYDIFISIRDPNEVLTTRGGRAPNKTEPGFDPRGFCALPFIDINVDYRGCVVNCCF